MSRIFLQALSLPAAAPILVITGAITGWPLALTCALVFVGAWAAVVTLRVRGILVRARATHPPVWDVFSHNDQMGLLDDAEYARTQLTVLKEPRLYVASALAIAALYLRMLLFLLRTLPIALFWIALMVALLSPDLLAAGVAAARQHGLAWMVIELRLHFWVLAVALLAFYLRPETAFIPDYFSPAVRDVLRRSVNRPTTTDLKLIRPAPGGPIVAIPGMPDN